MLGNTQLLIGEAGFGKSPVLMIIAHGLARYHANKNGSVVEPGARVTPDLDFLRGEAGVREVLHVLDDGDSAEQTPRVLQVS